MITLKTLENQMNAMYEKDHFVHSYHVDSNNIYHIYYNISTNIFTVKKDDEVMFNTESKLMVVDYINRL